MGDGRVKGWVTLAIVALVAAGCGGAGAADRSAGSTPVEATGRHVAAGSEPVTLSSTEDATPAPTVPTTAASPPTTAPRVAATVAPAPAPPVAAPSVTIAALNDGGITESNVGDCSTISSQTLTLGQLQVTRERRDGCSARRALLRDRSRRRPCGPPRRRHDPRGCIECGHRRRADDGRAGRTVPRAPRLDGDDHARHRERATRRVPRPAPRSRCTSTSTSSAAPPPPPPTAPHARFGASYRRYSDGETPRNR